MTFQCSRWKRIYMRFTRNVVSFTLFHLWPVRTMTLQCFEWNRICMRFTRNIGFSMWSKRKTRESNFQQASMSSSRKRLACELLPSSDDSVDTNCQGSPREHSENATESTRVQVAEAQTEELATSSSTNGSQSSSYQLDLERKRFCYQNNREHKNAQKQLAYYSNQSSTGLRLNRSNLAKRFAKFAFSSETSIPNEMLNHCGQMTKVCSFCSAIKFEEELDGLCCNHGKVGIEIPPELPGYLQNLFNGSHHLSKHFTSMISKYNAAFNITSFGTDCIKSHVTSTSTFKIQGQLCHRIGSLLPSDGGSPKYLQLFFLNREEEISYRMLTSDGMNGSLMEEIMTLLQNINQHIRLYKSCLPALSQQPNLRIIVHADRVPKGFHRRSFNAPEAEEVAGILVSDQEASNRDVVLRLKDGGLKRVSELHQFYDAFQYILLLPQGSATFHLGARNIGVNRKQTCVTALEYYRFLLFDRPGSYNQFIHGYALSQQWAVDQQFKIETQRLNYHRNNQDKLRTTEYTTLRDALMSGDMDPKDLGKRIVLPSSFHGCPRDKHVRSLDAMALVRELKKPDLFITMTCNPAWKEIQLNLLANEVRNDRQDLIARVFYMKKKFLIKLMVDFEYFGEVQAYVLSVEWQKRGLPHCHLLLWLTENLTSADYDRIISAEIPDKEPDPEGFELVTTHMIHGPCDELESRSPCLEKGKCSKDFPKKFNAETRENENGYPHYRRKSPENGGQTAVVKKNGKMRTIDNRWVVPHNKGLLKIFKCHVNVEICASVKSIKYVCKYIHKSSDMAVFTAGGDLVHDEILKYQIGRYLSANEAFWRLYGFAIHYSEPAVVQLQIHTEENLKIRYDENNPTIPTAPPKTHLMAFFDLCKTDAFARTLLYVQVPQYYTWNAGSRKWTRRMQGRPVPGQIGVKKGTAIGRVVSVDPNNKKTFFLRLLLHEVQGPTGFSYLKTFNGVLHSSFRDCCLARGFLENDDHLKLSLEEASSSCSPRQLRELFAIIYCHSHPSDPEKLWIEFKESFSEDFLHRMSDDTDRERHRAYQLCLQDIETLVRLSNQTLHDSNLNKHMDIAFEAGETPIDNDALLHLIDEREPLLNQEQRTVFNETFDSTSQHLFFLDAPGGTGKTFLLNFILAKAHTLGMNPVAVASSGIAATLLIDGRTAHSAFKLPLNFNTENDIVCNIAKESKSASYLRASKIIIWDECSMMHKRAFEAVDKLLQDICDNEKLFGGKRIILSGDFRQTLPVILNGTRSQEFEACLKNSVLWRKFLPLKLTVNMRAKRYNDSKFAEELLRIGEGKAPGGPEIDIPVSLAQSCSSLENLIETVFPNFCENSSDSDWLKDRAILTTLNKDARALNDILIEKVRGETVVYRSTDSVTNPDHATSFPVEFLNTLTPSGFPKQTLILKKGAIIMCLRNLSPPKLCNGTRLIVKSLEKNVIVAEIVDGNFRGNKCYIPRIPHLSTELPFEFKRVQFPIAVSFAMTINKSQGQTFSRTGILLNNQCFSHGQLYVALSRTGTSANTFYFSSSSKIFNVVYPEVFD